MKKFIFLLLLPFGIYAQSPIQVTSPYQYNKYVIILDSLISKNINIPRVTALPTPRRSGQIVNKQDTLCMYNGTAWIRISRNTWPQDSSRYASKYAVSQKLGLTATAANSALFAGRDTNYYKTNWVGDTITKVKTQYQSRLDTVKLHNQIVKRLSYVPGTINTSANGSIDIVGGGNFKINGVAVGTGAGTVTSVSVTAANGISGTVATATTTPAITLIPDTLTKFKTQKQARADTTLLQSRINKKISYSNTVTSAPDSVWSVYNVSQARKTATATIPYGYSITSYATGAAYDLTTTSAKIDFGTVDPEVTLSVIGTWKLTYSVMYQADTATITTPLRTITFKLREVTNTSSDIANSSPTMPLQLGLIATSETKTFGIYTKTVYYSNSSTTDKIQIFSNLSAAITSGKIRIVGASIIAEQIY